MEKTMLHANSQPLSLLEVKIKKVRENAVIPSYAKAGDMCMDLTAVDYHYDEELDCHVYHTGLAVEIPDGFGMLLFPRSSNRKTDAYMTNHVGVVDSGYRGEILICYKHRDSNITHRPYQIGDRVAQLCILPYPQIAWNVVDELSESERGEGGHGSTGN